MEKFLLKIGYAVFDHIEKYKIFKGRAIIRILLIFYFSLIGIFLRKRRFDVYLRIGTLCMSLNWLRIASQYYEQAHAMTKDDTQLARVYICIGNLHSHNGLHHKAIQYYEKALDVARFKTVIFSNLAYAYEAVGDEKKALAFAEKSLEMSKKETELGHTIPQEENISPLLSRLRERPLE